MNLFRYIFGTKKCVGELPPIQTQRSAFEFPEAHLNLTENEMNDLIIKGECQHNGIKITGYVENNPFGKSVVDRYLKKQNILLDNYKQEIKQVLRESFGFNGLVDFDLLNTNYQSKLRKSHVLICRTIEEKLRLK